MQLKPSAAHDAAYPNHYGARVTLMLPDGTRRVHGVRDSLGDPERPMDAAAVFAKAQSLMAFGGVDAARSREALDAASALLEAPAAALDQPFPHALLRPLFRH